MTPSFQSWVIRTLRPEDLAAVIEIARPWQGPLFSWDSKKLKNEMSQAIGYGFWDSSKTLKAFSFFRDLGQAWELTCLATDFRMQRQGVTFEFLKQCFSALSYKPEIWLEVHEYNESARNLYIKMGFYPTGLRPKYYSDKSAAILMTKKMERN